MSLKPLKQRWLSVTAVVVITAATLAGGLYERTRSIRQSAVVSGSDVPDELLEQFKEAIATAQENYAGPVDLERLGKYSIQGMLRQLDPHSAFFTKSEFDAVQTEQSSRIFGIGVTIAHRRDRVYIMSVTPGGPGYKAGLRYGDAVVSVDKQNVEEWSTEQVMYRVRGERGEPVELTVERAGASSPITFKIKRDEVKLPSVRNSFMLNHGGIGYIALTGGFSSKTDEELTEAMTRLKVEGLRQLVLDLRGNPGGLLDEAIKVSKKFLPPGEKILEVRGRDSQSSTSTYEVPHANVPETMPTVVLINNQTASASEIVAGALQDHERAMIVGETSFGKGLVQGVFRLWGGTGLVLTTGMYYTPSGRSIQRSYADVSFYDYYLNRTRAGTRTNGAPQGDAYRTDLGREVFGGGGITPDIVVKPAPFRGRLFYGVFDFVRQLVAGLVPGHREYRITEAQHRNKLSAEDYGRYPISDELIATFKQYVAAKPHFSVSEEYFVENLAYLKTLLKREIITAAYGPEAGDQAYLPEDPQFRQAVESLDKARALAENADRARNDRQ
jgi:carboxyl-terminal processing protease